MRGPDLKSIGRARRLRFDQTNAEAVLWNKICNRQLDGHKFVRQLPTADTSAISSVGRSGSSSRSMEDSIVIPRGMPFAIAA